MSKPNMIERTAQSMCDAAGEDWNAKSHLDTASGQDPEDMRDYWRMLATVAMQEVTTEAARTGLFQLGKYDRASTFFRSLNDA